MYITVNLHGGLGNQIFMMAALEMVSVLLKRKIYFNSLQTIGNHSNIQYFHTIFQYWQKFYKISYNTIQVRKETIQVWKESSFKLDIISILKMPYCDKTILDGFFINHNCIRPDFCSRLTFDETVLKKYPTISNKVFIHIRGGDYLTEESRLHFIDLTHYYERSIQFFDKDTEFLIFTNDLEYAKTFKFLTTISHSFISENEIDSLLIMSKCKGGICANSTFSWWGAYLNRNRKIILPSQFYTDPNIFIGGYYFTEAIIVDVKPSIYDFSFIDKVVYINLEKRKDRHVQMEEQLRIFGNKVHRFSAIEKSPGFLGCMLSHIGVLEMAFQNNWKNVLIFEDDILWNKFEQGYTLLKSLVANNYDVIHLGPSVPIYDTDTYRLLSGKTNSSYLVNNHYFQKLLDFYRSEYIQLEKTLDEKKYAADSRWDKLMKTDNWYAIIPSLCYQRSGNSDITNMNNVGEIYYIL